MRFVLKAALSGAAALSFAVAAQAADLPRQAPPPPPPTPPVFTWTGFYAGVNAGYAFPKAGSGFIDPTYGTVIGGGGRSGGFAGGGQVGYNRQFTPGSGFVVGVETDIQGTAFAKADAAYPGTAPSYSLRPSLDYVGTVRGRVGYAFDRVLICGTGGVAYGGGSPPSAASASPINSPEHDPDRLRRRRRRGIRLDREALGEGGGPLPASRPGLQRGHRLRQHRERLWRRRPLRCRLRPRTGRVERPVPTAHAAPDYERIVRSGPGQGARSGCLRHG